MTDKPKGYVRSTDRKAHSQRDTDGPVYRDVSVWKPEPGQHKVAREWTSDGDKIVPTARMLVKKEVRYAKRRSQ